MGLPHKLFQQSHIATKYAAINSGGVLGGFFAPMIIGDLVNATNSYQSAFLFLALTLLVSGLIVLAIKKINKIKGGKPDSCVFLLFN